MSSVRDRYYYYSSIVQRKEEEKFRLEEAAVALAKWL